LSEGEFSIPDVSSSSLSQLGSALHWSVPEVFVNKLYDTCCRNSAARYPRNYSKVSTWTSSRSSGNLTCNRSSHCK
jgi:hypothetical protein